MPVQHRQQHGQTVAFQAHAQAARAGPGAIHQCLDFHQQRPAALQRDEHAAPGHRLAVRAQENRAGVAHPFQALLRHGEHAHLVDGAKAVLEGADQPVGAVRIALEVQHGIDDMLQHARASQLPVLGHMAHQHHGRAAGLGKTRQVRRAFAHLCHAARRAAQRIAIDGLDRVDHRHLRLFGLQRAQNLFQLDFGQYPHL